MRLQQVPSFGSYLSIVLIFCGSQMCSYNSGEGVTMNTQNPQRTHGLDFKPFTYECLLSIFGILLCKDKTWWATPSKSTSSYHENDFGLLWKIIINQRKSVKPFSIISIINSYSGTPLPTCRSGCWVNQRRGWNAAKHALEASGPWMGSWNH